MHPRGKVCYAAPTQTVGLAQQPHAGIRKLESAPIPIGDFEASMPALSVFMRDTERLA